MDRGLGAFERIAQVLQPLDPFQYSRGPFAPLGLAQRFPAFVDQPRLF